MLVFQMFLMVKIPHQYFPKKYKKSSAVKTQVLDQ